MKKVIISLILLAMLAGCLGQAGTAQPTKEEVGKALGNVTAAPVKELISVGGSDNLSVVSISAVNQNGSWLFPMKDYEGQFQSAGLYSTAFMQLNGSQIRWLDAGESIWLTAMVRNGTGVLFNAVYSNDAVNCSTGNIRILGRDYALSGLRNGSSFLRDDKWKVAVDSQGGCPSRILIYMDGYFDRMKDGEQINLFRNDNTVLLSFEGLATSPSLRMIAIEPGITATTENRTMNAGPNRTTITDRTSQDTVTQSFIRTYNDVDVLPGQQQVVDTFHGGKIITETTTFDTPLQVFTDSAGGRMLKTNGYRAMNNLTNGAGGKAIPEVLQAGLFDVPKCQATVLGEDYVLLSFNDSGIVLAKESAAGIIDLEKTLTADGLTFRLDRVGGSGSPSNLWWANVSILDTNGNVLKKDKVGESETKDYIINGKDHKFHVYQVAPGYTFAAQWARVAVFSEMAYVEDGGTFTASSNQSYSFSMNRSGDTLQGWQFRALP
ncbi:MAG: hypothetical protein PHV13_02355 [Candidatus ainarchaeum sp.]|nr:hypothetical protein [Candidatus ainarchaeum sp.]